MNYKIFDEWFWEIERDQIRSEKFWDDIDNDRRLEIYHWMKFAYESGFQQGKIST